MTGARTDKAEIIARLEACGEVRLPAKAAHLRRSLLAKLQGPVRLGLFGLPGAGKRAVAHALFGDAVGDPALPLPSFEISRGETAQTEAVLPDGRSVNLPGFPTRAITGRSPVFLGIRTPDPALPGCSLLVVAADRAQSDQSAALEWASARVDIALWCARTWTAAEHEIWTAAPDTLRNHAILLLTGADADMAGTRRAVAPHLFNSVVALTVPRDAPAEASPGAAAHGLTAALSVAIDEAATQDMLAAEMLLHRYAPRGAGRTAEPTPAEPTAPTQHGRAGAADPEPVPDPDPDPEAQHALARAFQALRQAAEALRGTLPAAAGAPLDVESCQSAIEAIFEDLADRVCGNPSLAAAWPRLCADISEAHDLALLMRIEGGAGQLEDAAMLLLQIREDMEVRLAA